MHAFGLWKEAGHQHHMRIQWSAKSSLQVCFQSQNKQMVHSFIHRPVMFEQTSHLDLKIIHAKNVWIVTYTVSYTHWLLLKLLVNWPGLHKWWQTNSLTSQVTKYLQKEFWSSTSHMGLSTKAFNISEKTNHKPYTNPWILRVSSLHTHVE